MLVGGRGTRLRAAVSDRPKPLALVRGRPFLDRLLDQLQSAGVQEVFLLTGHRAHQVEEHYGPRYRELTLHHRPESAPLGTGGAVRQSLAVMTGDPLLILNGDSYCAVDLKAFSRWHHDRGAAGSLVLTRVDDTSRYGRVECDPAGAVTAFVEKGQGSGPGWINAGIYLLARRTLQDVPPDRSVSLEREVFPVWIGRGLLGYPGGGRFLDIGTPESYRQAERFFQD